jgi:hypothetical protein
MSILAISAPALLQNTCQQRIILLADSNRQVDDDNRGYIHSKMVYKHILQVSTRKLIWNVRRSTDRIRMFVNYYEW